MSNYPMSHFNENRSFGVEIEFKGDKWSVFNELKNIGIDVVMIGYSHEVMSAWKLTTDASAEWELVSPILKGRDGLEQLEKVCKAFAKTNAKVDKSCGFHVHHDVNDYTLGDFKSLFATYLKVEVVLDSFMPESRRLNNNRYCKSLSALSRVNGYYSSTDMNDLTAPTTADKVKMLEAIKRAQSVKAFDSAVGVTRYSKINYQSYMKYGTVEFRQHSATLEYAKMYNWILLTQHMVNLAQDRHITYGYNPVYWDTMGYFSEVMRMTPKYGADEEIANCLKWYRNRAQSLKKDKSND